MLFMKYYQLFVCSVIIIFFVLLHHLVGSNDYNKKSDLDKSSVI